MWRVRESGRPVPGRQPLPFSSYLWRHQALWGADTHLWGCHIPLLDQLASGSPPSPISVKNELDVVHTRIWSSEKRQMQTQKVGSGIPRFPSPEPGRRVEWAPSGTSSCPSPHGSYVPWESPELLPLASAHGGPTQHLAETHRSRF